MKEKAPRKFGINDVLTTCAECGEKIMRGKGTVGAGVMVVCFDCKRKRQNERWHNKK